MLETLSGCLKQSQNVDKEQVKLTCEVLFEDVSADKFPRAMEAGKALVGPSATQGGVSASKYEQELSNDNRKGYAYGKADEKHTPVTSSWEQLSYLQGFGNEFSSEALVGALPERQNNPKVCPMGLYAEQVSGSAFTAPRAQNQRTWLYRILPSVTHTPFKMLDAEAAGWRVVSDFSPLPPSPNQMRWRPLDIQDGCGQDFVSGMSTVCGAGSPSTKDGYAIHLYCADSNMGNKCLANADGDYLVVPQWGTLHITTELGRLEVPPGHICVLPRGLRFHVALPQGPSRGYILEVFSVGHWQLPERGVIGANGLADQRHFQAPAAWFEDVEFPVRREGEGEEHGDGGYRVWHKFEGQLFEATQSFSPFNVVAWHGNYVPYRYDLSKFCPMNAVLFDHPDPSIFTVLTFPSPTAGLAVCDFVVFPPRWSVAERTFRPPYFHRNILSEFMGLIRGEYEAKDKDGFQPGGSSLHSCMTPHGPDTSSYEAAVAPGKEGPSKLPEDTLAFMFETNFTPRVTTHAQESVYRDLEYYTCWQGLKRHFRPNPSATTVAADAKENEDFLDAPSDFSRVTATAE